MKVSEIFEIWRNELKLKLKVYFQILLLLIIVQVVVFGYWAVYQHIIIVTDIWDVVEFVALFHSVTSGSFINDGIANAWLRLFFAIVVIPFGAFVYFFRLRAQEASKEKYIRGSRLISTKSLCREIRRRREAVDLPMGSIKMPTGLENRHTFIIGKPGTGKTTLFNPIIMRLYERGERGIILDTKGDYVCKHYREETDVILNPLDIRMGEKAGWNIFNELEIYPDIDVVASSLIPDTDDEKSKFWTGGANAVFAGILSYLHQNNRCTNKDLWLALTEPAAEIFKKLTSAIGGEAGARYLEPDKKGSRQANILATLMQHTSAFEYMTEIDGKFKISDWLSEDKPGFIYITNYKQLTATLKPILSLFIDLLSRRLLSMPDNLNRRIFFLLDEFGSLQKLSSIVELLTEGRSKGACVFLATQDVGRVEDTYGPNLLESIENACGNRITLALSGKAAKREAELHLGESESQLKNKSSNISAKASRAGANFSEQKSKGLIFLPSEISNIRDLTGIVKFRNYDFTISKWTWFPLENRCESFILRPGLSLAEIKAKADAKAKAEKMADSV